MLHFLYIFQLRRSFSMPCVKLVKLVKKKKLNPWLLHNCRLYLHKFQLLCVKGDYILLACSSLSDRPNLVVGRKTRCDTGLQWSFQNNQTIYGCPLRNGLISYRNQPFYNYTNDLFEVCPFYITL